MLPAIESISGILWAVTRKGHWQNEGTKGEMAWRMTLTEAGRCRSYPRLYWKVVAWLCSSNPVYIIAWKAIITLIVELCNAFFGTAYSTVLSSVFIAILLQYCHDATTLLQYQPLPPFAIYTTLQYHNLPLCKTGHCSPFATWYMWLPTLLQHCLIACPFAILFPHPLLWVRKGPLFFSHS